MRDTSRRFTDEEQSAFRLFLRDLVKFGLFWCPPITALVTFALGKFDSFPDYLEDAVVSVFIGEIVLLCALSGSYVLGYLEQLLYEIINRPFIERSNMTHMFRSFIFVWPAMTLAFHLSAIIFPQFGIEFSAPETSSYKRGLLFAVVSCFLYFALELFLDKRRSDVQIKKLEKENLESKVSALSAQMNPHLLFNALNSVASTIKENPDAAEDMTVELAGLYRMTLKATKVDKHKIADEIAICKSYLNVEKSRFTDRLEFAISVMESVENLEIPSLLVQPLVENAIKHGIGPKPEGGTVSLTVENASTGIVTITVEDNGVGYNPNRFESLNGTGTGLSNCKNRLELIYGTRATVKVMDNNPGTKVQVRIPLTSKAES